ncbi:MAG: SusC/RagA family TonB-linked outer membrane protein [Bacteroidales bacterium]|jgi:TonB-linked SusC/RagA family outer membrane protein
MRKLILLFVLVLFTAFQVLAQRTITGTVSDTEGGTVPGVTVIVKGTQIGTTTDNDGYYSIEVPSKNSVLVFSFVGMETVEVAQTDSPIINVVMEQALKEIEGVVVTALGISREKKSLGYAVQEVKGDELTKASNPNLETTISGKFAGIQVRQSSGMPGSPSQILIRGARAFSGNNSPLYVVDGMPITSESDYTSNVTGSAFSNRAMDIDPNDIESMTVLKGQSASALYGMRASNGVILITTKKGKEAAGLGRPQVSFSSSVTTDVISRLPEVQQIYAQGTEGEFVAASSFAWGPKITDLPNDPVYGGNNYPGHDGQFFDPYKNQWVTPIAYNNPLNFYDNNAISYNNGINISNATNIGTYALGFGSTNQTGIIKGTGMDRYNAKMAGDFKMSRHWNMGFSGNYSDSKINKIPSGNSSWLFTVYGAPPSFDLAGTPYHQEGTFGKYRQISFRRGSVGKNPYWVIENNKYTEATKRFFGNGYLEYKPVSWMAAKYQIGVDQYTTHNSIYTEMGEGNLPSGSQYPTPNNPEYAFVMPTGGQIVKDGVSRRTINSLATLAFNHNFTDDIKGDLLLGNEIDHTESEYYTARGSSFTTPGWDNLENTNIKNSAHYKYSRRTAGFFANMNLSYQSMLFLNLTTRTDVVSSMPRGNRTFTYPSASLSWAFTELDQLKDNYYLSFGKLRVSYAQVGQAADAFYSLPYYVTGGANSGFLSYGVEYPWQGVTGYKLVSRIYDPDLKPQNTGTFEIGTELRFFFDRIAIDYTYFNSIAEGQIFAVPIAGSTGYAEVVKNAGKMKNVGHEIMLKTRPVESPNFIWDANINFTKLDNKVIELAPGVESIFLGGYVTPNIRASAGDSYPAIYGEQFLRDEEGRILVEEDPNNENYGLPKTGDFGKIGEVSPNFFVTFLTNFNLYKYVNIHAQLDWKDGGQTYSGSNRLMDLYGVSKRTEDRETPFIYPGYKANGEPNDIQRGGPGDEIAYEQFYGTALDALSEAHIYGTSFVKLREVGISFNLPKKWISPLLMRNASIGFVARNILLWTELPNFDPEMAQGQGNMTGGLDYMSLPQTTSYGINLNITF